MPQTRQQRRAARRRERSRRGLVLWSGITLAVVIGLAALFYVGSAGRRAAASFAVNPGDPAPEFSLPVVGGGTASLAELRARGPVLLFFQEGIMCQPCWDQVVAIQRDYAQFRALGLQVVSITVDPINHLVTKVQQEGIALPVLADEGARVSREYDTLRFGSMHPGQRPGHTFVLVDRDGTIRWRRDFREMFVRNEVLLRDLRGILR